MKGGKGFGKVAAWASHHAWLVIGVAVVVAVVSAVSALQLETDGGTDTLVDRDSASFRATENMRAVFGDDPVIVLVKGDLTKILESADLVRLLALEGCLSGNVPRGGNALPGACAELAKLKPAQLVSGPASFLNTAVIGLNDQLQGRYKQAVRLAKAASRAAAGRAAAKGLSVAQQSVAAQQTSDAIFANFQQQLVALASQYGLTKIPTLADSQFTSAVVFDPNAPKVGTPKAKLSYLFPGPDAAQIVIRLRPDLTNAERRRAISLIKGAVADTTPQQACAPKGKDPQPCFVLKNGSYVVSGAPVVIDGLTSTLKVALLVLFAAAVVLMGLTLTIAFRSHSRQLPLGVALIAASISFGILKLAGGTLTMGSIAVLPVLIGLSVDYAIQLQARFDEAVANGLAGADAARDAALRAGPTIGTACLATAVGFLALQLSPTPMVRSFGLLLIVGIGIAFVLALTVGLAALTLRRERSGDQAPEAGARASGLGSRLTAWRDFAADLVGRAGRGAIAVAIAGPGRVLSIALVLAVCGWAAGSGMKTVSDIRELVSPNLAEVRDLNDLQDSTGVAGELDVTVRSSELASPAVLEWMRDFKARVLTDAGYSRQNPNCPDAELCPGPSLTDFLPAGGGKVTGKQVATLLATLPSSSLEGVAQTDPATGRIGEMANIAFAVRLGPLDQQQDLINQIRSEVGTPGTRGGPPEGTTVEVAGLQAIVAESATDLAHSRYWLTLAGLLAVALILICIYRSISRAFVPLIPIVFGTGWASLMLAAMHVSLNPMSTAFGVLVIAIATEFSVILASRFREERLGGRELRDALTVAYSSTGAAVFVSGLTVIVGFAALMASDITMLRDFGLATVVDLSVALLGVLTVLPAALVWIERRRDRDPSSAPAGAPADDAGTATSVISAAGPESP